MQKVHRAIMLDVDAGADANEYADVDDDEALVLRMGYSRQTVEL